MGEFMSSSLEIILFETPAVVSTLKNHGDTHSVPKEKTLLHLGVCVCVCACAYEAESKNYLPDEQEQREEVSIFTVRP